MRDWRRIRIVGKDKRLSLESWSSNPWSIFRYYKKVCVKISMNEFGNVWDCARGTSSITQTPGISVCRDCEKTDRSTYHCPVNQAASLMSAGLLASGSGCNRNLLWWNHRVSCPFPLWRNWGPLWCCRKIPAVFEWIWWMCFVAMIVFCRCQTALCSALMIGGAALYVKWTPMSFRKSFEEKFVHVHQNTCMWNLKPYLWSVRYFRWGGSVCFVLFTEDLFLLQMDWSI